MKKKEIPYQFTALPVNLTACLDNNCRGMLFTLLQLSSYFENRNKSENKKWDGWFFRSNADLQAESRLSENLVRATISTLYRIGIVDVKLDGKSKNQTPNKFRLNEAAMLQWEKYSLEDCIKNPDYAIKTDQHKATGWKPSYLVKASETIPQSQPLLPQSEDNIDNAANVENTENADNTETIEKKEKKEENIDTYQGTLGESLDNALSADEKKRNEFWYMVDYYLSRIQHASHWHEWESHLTDLDQLLLNPPTSELGEQAKAKLSTILREEVQSYKRKYEDATTDKSGDVYDDYCSSNTDEVDDGDEELEEPDVETEAEDFYFQLKEWKEYSKERDGAFSYFADEPINAPY